MNKWTQIAAAFLIGASLSLTSLTSQAANYPDFTQLVEDNAPAVVNISTKKFLKRTSRHPQMPSMPDEIFRHFFGIPGMPQQQPKEEASSIGSGFIISNDGYIVTNHHVIEGADEILVRLSDHKVLEAELIGSDKRTDVALIKVKAKNLPIVKLGQSDELKVGEWVAAIGSPFGFDYTVTSGIVSAKKRSLPNDLYVPFIQTDVAINPGNSGGPLFNLNGEVIGINSQIYSRSGGFMGLSFAIPVDLAMYIVDQIKKDGFVTRGYLGVQIQEVTYELAESFGMKKPQGALVAQVYPDSPAAKAGLEAGDVIIEYKGKPIEKSWDLPPIVGMTPVETEAELTLIREGDRLDKQVVIEALSDEKTARAPKGQLKNSTLGADFRDLTPEEREEIALDYGVLVKKVQLEGAFANAGVREGDVLLSINRRAVKSVKSLRSMLKDLPEGTRISLRVWRDGEALFTTIRLR